jgi:hypothetical protein
MFLLFFVKPFKQIINYLHSAIYFTYFVRKFTALLKA